MKGILLIRQRGVSDSLWRPRFEEKYPLIKVELQGYPWGEYFDKITTLVAAKAAPDVIHVWVDQVQIFIRGGSVISLEPYIERDAFDVGIFPECIDIARYEGELYGFPRDGGVFSDRNIYYNRDLFREAGIPFPESYPKDPDKGWTWGDFVEIAKALTKDTNGDGKIDQWGMLPSLDAFQVYPMVWSNGGDFLNEQGTKCTLTSPEAIEAIQLLADLRVKHHVSPFPEDIEGMGDIFMTGQCAMRHGAVMYGQALNKAGVEFDWSIADYPRLKAGVVNLACTHPIMITTASPHPDAAWEWLKYTVSFENQYFQAVETVSFPPQTIPVARLDEWVHRDTPPYDYSPFAYGQTKTIPKIPQWRRIVQEILQPELEPVWLGTATAAEVVPTICEKMDKLLAESG